MVVGSILSTSKKRRKENCRKYAAQKPTCNSQMSGLLHCAGFGWDRVNFLHSSWYGAMFWICAGNSGDNTRIFVLQWDNTVFAIAEQRLDRVKAFAASHTTPPARRLGVHKKLGGDTAGTADPTWPKGYSIPYGIMLRI